MRFDANIAASGTISAPIGTFDSLTVSGIPVSTGTGGGASLDPSEDQTITGNWDFQSGLTKNGVNVATEDDLVGFDPGTNAAVSGTIIRPLGLAHNPLALWTFDGDLTDSSGNGNTLSSEVNNGTDRIVRIAPYLSGYSFPGDTILIAPDDPAFKITGDVTWQAIVIYAADAVVSGTKTIAGQLGPSGDGDDTLNYLYRMAVINSESLQYFAEEAGGTNITFASAEKLNGLARRLQHIAIVRESNDVTVYVDGIRHDSSSGLNTPVGGSATRFRIGGDIAGGAGANFFTGIITSVKINDFAMSDAQIRREYESTLATAVIPEEFTTVSGAFTQSLTISGVPVATAESFGRGEFSGALVVLSGSNFPLTSFVTGFVEFDHVEYDTDGYFTLSSGVVLTVPEGKGITHVVLTGQAFFEGDPDANTVRSVSFRKSYLNMVPKINVQAASMTNTTHLVQVVSHPILVADGDEFSFGAFENTGNDLDVISAGFSTWFSIEDVTPRGVLISGTGGGGSSLDEIQVALLSQVYGS